MRTAASARSEVRRCIRLLGEVAFRAGDDDTAHARWAEAEALRREHLGGHHVSVAQVQARLAGIDLNRGDLSRARTRLEAVIDFSDSLTFAMALANVFGLYLLAPVVKRDLAEYRRGLDATDSPASAD